MASTKFLSNLVIDGSGGTVLDVQGSVGQLFSVTDSLTGDLFAVSDISGIPILNVNSSGAVDIDGTLSLGDSNKIQLGASQDLQIFHNGNDSYIQDSGTGDLRIISSATRFTMLILAIFKQRLLMAVRLIYIMVVIKSLKPQAQEYQLQEMGRFQEVLLLLVRFKEVM